MTSVEIHVDQQVTLEDEAELVRCLGELGLPPSAPVRLRPPVREEAIWQVLVTLPLTGFLTAIGGKLGTDAYRHLVAVIRRLFARQPRPMVLRDVETGIEIIIDRDLPDHAYLALPSLNLAKCRDTVRYDRKLGQWRDTTGNG